MAQAFHHSILPLASAPTGEPRSAGALREFELRFGRRPAGLWLPETAVDLPTLRIAAEEGVRYTILAPWQAADPGIDTRRPYRVEVGDGLSIVVVFYDAGLSTAVSFEPEATSDADRFARERVAARLSGGDAGRRGAAGGRSPPTARPTATTSSSAICSCSGSSHPARATPDRGFDVVSLADAVAEPPDRPFPIVRIADRTSWSCHHGVLRWWAECPDAADGRWKGPLRAALERLAGGIDHATEALFRDLPGAPDPWPLRDAWVDVVVGATTADGVRGRARPVGRDRRGPRRGFLGLLEAQRWRLAMFASDGWFWDDPVRLETRQVLRAAARAARHRRRAQRHVPRAAAGRGPRAVRVALTRARRRSDLSDGARRTWAERGDGT